MFVEANEPRKIDFLGFSSFADPLMSTFLSIPLICKKNMALFLTYCVFSDIKFWLKIGASRTNLSRE